MKTRLAVVLAGAMVLSLGSMGRAQPVAATQPSTGGAPARMYVVPGPMPSFVRPLYGYSQQVPSSIPASEIAQEYSCVVRLDPQTDSGTLNYGGSNDGQTAVALLTSTALGDPAAKQILNLDSAQSRDLVVVSATPAGLRLVRLDVILRKSPGHDYAVGASAKLSSALLARLKAAYAASAAAAQSAATARRGPLAAKLQQAQQRLDDLRKKERDTRVQAALLGINPQFDVSGQISNLEMQKRSTETELNRNRARLKGFEHNSAPLIAQWTQIISFRQKRLDELKKDAAKHSGAEQAVQEAIAELADAKAQLQQARQFPDNPQDINAGFRRSQASGLRATVAEQEDHLKQVNDELSKLQEPKLQEMLQQFPGLQMEQSRARGEISDLQNRLEQERRSVEADGSMIITVLDGGK